MILEDESVEMHGIMLLRVDALNASEDAHPAMRMIQLSIYARARIGGSVSRFQ